MDKFRARLVDTITGRFDTVPAREELAQKAVETIMMMVREAIETPRQSSEIDTWLVRTAMGKIGTRASETVAEAFVGDDPKVLDRNVEIYARIYDTERHCGALSHEAAERAHKVVESMNRIGVISGKK